MQWTIRYSAEYWKPIVGTALFFGSQCRNNRNIFVSKALSVAHTHFLTAKFEAANYCQYFSRTDVQNHKTQRDRREHLLDGGSSEAGFRQNTWRHRIIVHHWKLLVLTVTSRNEVGAKPKISLSPHYEIYWSRIRKWIVQNFQILIVSAVKICKQCLQTASASGGLVAQTPSLVPCTLYCKKARVAKYPTGRLPFPRPHAL